MLTFIVLKISPIETGNNSCWGNKRNPHLCSVLLFLLVFYWVVVAETKENYATRHEIDVICTVLQSVPSSRSKSESLAQMAS